MSSKVLHDFVAFCITYFWNLEGKKPFKLVLNPFGHKRVFGPSLTKVIIFDSETTHQQNTEEKNLLKIVTLGSGNSLFFLSLKKNKCLGFPTIYSFYRNKDFKTQTLFFYSSEVSE